MAAHLEAQPAMRAVVNFVPVLLDQIEDYAEQFGSGELRDPLLAALARPRRSRSLDEEERTFAARPVLRREPRAHDRALPRLPRACTSWAAGRRGRPAALPGRRPILDDLLVWYLLAWTGETVRRASPLIQS